MVQEQFVLERVHHMGEEEHFEQKFGKFLWNKMLDYLCWLSVPDLVTDVFKPMVNFVCPFRETGDGCHAIRFVGRERVLGYQKMSHDIFQHQRCPLRWRPQTTPLIWDRSAQTEDDWSQMRRCFLQMMFKRNCINQLPNHCLCIHGMITRLNSIIGWWNTRLDEHGRLTWLFFGGISFQKWTFWRYMLKPKWVWMIWQNQWCNVNGPGNKPTYWLEGSRPHLELQGLHALQSSLYVPVDKVSQRTDIDRCIETLAISEFQRIHSLTKCLTNWFILLMFLGSFIFVHWRTRTVPLAVRVFSLLDWRRWEEIWIWKG